MSTGLEPHPPRPQPQESLTSLRAFGIDVRLSELKQLWYLGREKHPWKTFLAEFEADFRQQLDAHQPARGVPSDQLVTAREKNQFFKQTMEILYNNDGQKLTTWNGMLSELSPRGILSEVGAILQPRLNRNALLELGVGNETVTNRRIAQSAFRVEKYEGIDRVACNDLVVDPCDALLALENRPPASSSIMAFGFCNEPLSPALSGMYHSSVVGIPSTMPDPPQLKAARMIECEYAQRFVEACKKVVPIGGLLFGDGIRSSFYYTIFEDMLAKHGFARLEKAYELTRSACLSGKSQVKDPFFFERVAG